MSFNQVYFWANEYSKVKWDRRFLLLSQHISWWSKDPSTKVGAVIADGDRRILSVGYNGFPAGIEDNSRLHQREQKYPMIIHAEVNALHFAPRFDLTGASLYTWPFPSCATCAAQFIQRKISRVVAPNKIPDRWKDSCDIAIQMFNEAGVTVQLDDMEANI